MIPYRLVPISSQKGVLFLRHPVVQFSFGIAHCGKMRGAGSGQYDSGRFSPLLL